jgi:hypothetical protein
MTQRSPHALVEQGHFYSRLAAREHRHGAASRGPLPAVARFFHETSRTPSTRWASVFLRAPG